MILMQRNLLIVTGCSFSPNSLSVERSVIAIVFCRISAPRKCSLKGGEIYRRFGARLSGITCVGCVSHPCSVCVPVWAQNVRVRQCRAPPSPQAHLRAKSRSVGIATQPICRPKIRLLITAISLFLEFRSNR